MINKDERYIRKRYGKGNHFVAPEGYFDSLTSRVMQNVTAKADQSSSGDMPLKIVSMSPWQRHRKAIVSVAASVCVAMLSLGAYFHAADVKEQKPVAQKQDVIAPTTDYSSLDEAVDYSMMDSEDMYAYMADLN